MFKTDEFVIRAVYSRTQILALTRVCPGFVQPARYIYVQAIDRIGQASAHLTVLQIPVTQNQHVSGNAGVQRINGWNTALVGKLNELACATLKPRGTHAR